MSKEINTFSSQDEQLLVLISSHLAGLLENMRLSNETQERAKKLQDTVRQLQAVRETALDISSALDLNILLTRIAHRAQILVDARGAELGLYNEKDKVVTIVVSETPWENFSGIYIPIMEGIAGKMAVSGEPIVVRDYNSWPGRLLPERQAPFRTAAGVPLKIKGQVIGTLTVMDDRDDKSFSEDDIQLLELLSPQASISIGNARLYQELQERIEAQRRAESNLIRSARLAAVGEMAAGVAHELNNPLTTVTGFVELVMDDLDNTSAQYADLDLALQEALRARGVVRRMLDFSRPAEVQHIKTDLNELVRQVLTLTRHMMNISGVSLDLELKDNLPWISADSNQIQQVLHNLISNAVQAMPSGGRLTIRTDTVEREGSNWVITEFVDTGVGIPPENLDRIFEPFFTTRVNNKGTGLGLSVSYGIVESHGGFIDVISQVGLGSCFTIFLPTQQKIEMHDVR
jgi:two-component system NtrC family sensor kinase